MPLQATSGAASYDGFGGGVAAVPNYIEDVFSTYLYTGNGTSQTITNGIDLSTKGGMVWSKSRSSADNNVLLDTVRGANSILVSNTTAAASISGTPYVTATTTGYSIGTSNSQINASSTNYVSWTFRKQPKFFDVVTFSGNSTSGRQIAHNLGATVGCIIVKNLTNADEWLVWHRSLGDFGGAGKNLVLNSTAAEDTGNYFGTAATQTSTYFTVNADVTKINWSGNNYVAYLFAHNAGGFGLTGTDNVISCGSFTSDSNGRADVNLGYEPQFVLTKVTNITGNWEITDTMRGLLAKTGIDNTGSANVLFPNLSNAETADADNISVTTTGFYIKGAGISNTYIYIAIRRGPMKVPTSGTSVLGFNARSGTGANATVTGLSPTDLAIIKRRDVGNGAPVWAERLAGFTYMTTNSTAGQISGSTILQNPPFDVQNGVKISTSSTVNASGSTYINYLFGRAPNAFDIVCYTGTGANTTQSHNLASIPELMIVKRRDSTGAWTTYCSALGNTNYLDIDSTAASASGATRWNNTTPTSTVFSIGTSTAVNASGATYIAFLFATCANVSKVGSYTGTATTLQIDCGFTSGARFVLIKRTDSTGDWYVWDSTRGIVSGNDPYFLLNSAAIEVTNTDYVDTYSAGFELSSTAPAAINASGGSFIFLAIA